MSSSLIAVTHAKERAFFDAEAERARVERLDRKILQRYVTPGRLFPLEFVYRVLGDVTGRKVLDVGCGLGQSTLLLSRFGADVAGVDISAGSIRAAERLMAVNGARASFICSPFEDLDSNVQYDIVWVQALLHHILHDLERQLVKLRSLVRPGGMIVMMEPVDLVPGLRALRLAVGPPPEATDDERPLRRADLDIVRKVLPSLETRNFRTLGRLDKLLLGNRKLEEAGVLRAGSMKAIAAVDYVLNSVPVVRRAGSVMVMWARL